VIILLAVKLLREITGAKHQQHHILFKVVEVTGCIFEKPRVVFEKTYIHKTKFIDLPVPRHGLGTA